MNSMISVFAKRCKREQDARCFPKKAKPVAGKVVSPPRGPARVPATCPLFIYRLALCLPPFLSLSHILLIYFPNNSHATAPPIHQLNPTKQKAVTARWDEVSEQEQYLRFNCYSCRSRPTPNVVRIHLGFIVLEAFFNVRRLGIQEIRLGG